MFLYLFIVCTFYYCILTLILGTADIEPHTYWSSVEDYAFAYFETSLLPVKARILCQISMDETIKWPVHLLNICWTRDIFGELRSYVKQRFQFIMKCHQHILDAVVESQAALRVLWKCKVTIVCISQKQLDYCVYVYLYTENIHIAKNYLYEKKNSTI